MSAAAVIGMIAGRGAGQVAASAPSAALAAVGWIAVALVVIGAAYLVAYLRLPGRRMPLLALPPAGPCPCCTGRPAESDDCSCREDCGISWCQAADPPDHIEGCGPGHNLLAYPSLACPACDRTAARMDADPGGTQPHPAPRPECPWCDTRECIDRTLCNCEKPCGSWLCVVKEESRG